MDRSLFQRIRDVPVFHIHGEQHLFIHIPKTGGSSIEESLAPHLEIRLKYNGVPPGHPCPPQHLHLAELGARCDLAAMKSKFAIIRHPIARLISEFKFRTASRNTLIDFDLWATRALRLAKSDPYYLDNHMRPQTEFVGDDVDILRFEDGMETLFAAILGKLGLADRKIPLVWEKRSAPRRIRMTHRLRAAIQETYAQDFDAFGYDPNTGFSAEVTPDPAPISLRSAQLALQRLLIKPDDKRKYRRRR